MTDLIGLIGTSVTIAKGLLEIDKQYNDSVFKRQFSELNYQLALAYEEGAKMVTEFRALKTEIEEQENNPLSYNGIAYRDRNNFLYCPACYDNSKKRIHLKKRGVYLTCPICGNDYE